MPLADGKLVVLTYTAAGFVPAIIEPQPLKDVSAITFLGAALAEKYPVVTTWQVPAASTVDDEKLITAKERPYVPLRRLELSNAFPVLQGYKNTIGAGYHANFEDPLHFASLGITAAYTPEEKLQSDERGHVDITGRYGFWHGELSWNRSDFYDLFGPTERSRKGYAARLGYDWLLIYDTPRRLDLLFDVAYYDKIDTLPNAQNIETNFTQLATAEVGLHYTDVKRSLGAVDDEKGVTWELVYYGSHVPGETAPQFRAGLDLGFPVPLPHSSIWLRSAAGVANGDRNSVIGNFYFGAFGNNYVDDGSIKRYRDYSSLPGFQIDEISAQNYVREMVEWQGATLGWGGRSRSILMPGGWWCRPSHVRELAMHQRAAPFGSLPAQDFDVFQEMSTPVQLRLPRLVNSVADSQEPRGYIHPLAAYVKDVKWRR